MELSATIALADDHVMIRKALAAMIEGFGGFHVVLQASNGNELLAGLGQMEQLPQIVLLDIQMPELNGIETARQIASQYPGLKFMALSMKDNEESIIGMVKLGARGYLLKDGEPEQLKQALHNVITKGFHYSDLVTGRLVHQLQNDSAGKERQSITANLNQREIEFLKLSATELTYKEIAGTLNVSPRTVDGYRDNLFEKLGIKSRVGLAMFAVRMNFL